MSADKNLNTTSEFRKKRQLHLKYLSVIIVVFTVFLFFHTDNKNGFVFENFPKAYIFGSKKQTKENLVHDLLGSTTQTENATIQVSQNQCNFITFEHKGRTGNKMFAYASMYGLAKSNGKFGFISDEQFSLLNVFRLSLPVWPNVSNRLFENLEESGAYSFDEDSQELNCSKNYTVRGFRCSWKYFEKYEKEIRAEFRFKPNVEKQCQSVLLDISIKHQFQRSKCNLIGCHMRRGDFLLAESQRFGHVPASGQYLTDAVEFFEKRLDGAKCNIFLIFGEDYAWNLANSPNRSNIIVVKPADPVLDLCVLSKCNHTIISTGSYGWWAAFLAGGDAALMKNQCKPNSSLCNLFNYQNYINPKWNWFAL